MLSAMTNGGRSMKLGSLFSGSGMFELAGALTGIEPVWNAEIDPHAVKVTDARLPHCKQLGSVTEVNGADVEPVDILTFGSPCQDLSIAGARAGIHDGTRSILFFEAIRIAKEMRDATANQFPRFLVWENVANALNINKGADFHAVLQEFVSINDPFCAVPRPPKCKWSPSGCIVGDGYSVAWRTYDTQFYGAPQRRKRVYIVCDLGSERAGEILFKPEGSRGNYPPEPQAVETASRYLDVSPHWRCAEGTTADGVIFDARGNGDGKISCTITGDHQNRITDYTAIVVQHYFDLQRFGQYGTGGVASTVLSRDYKYITDIIVEDQPENRVRRLTPAETARLQGFPEGWLDGVGLSDTAKYRICGNAVSLPCVLDIMGRIADEA